MPDNDKHINSDLLEAIVKHLALERVFVTSIENIEYGANLSILGGAVLTVYATGNFKITGDGLAAANIYVALGLDVCQGER